MNKKVYTIDIDKIMTAEVEKGKFQDIIMIDANIEPIYSVLLNNPDGGSVEEVYVEDGAYVEQGTPLLRLSNPTVMLGYMNQETAIIEQINNLRNLKLSLEQDQRNLNESLIDAEYELTNLERDYFVDTTLYAKGAIAKNDFIDSEEAYHYQIKKKEFLEKNVNKSSRENAIQIEQIKRSITLMERNLELIHQNMDKMLVKAPISGRISSFDPIIGQSFSPQETIAKIDVLKGYKVRGQVDEFYLSQVDPGQSARFSFDGQLIELEVQKVLPEVNNSKFEIVMHFIDSVSTKY